MFVCVTVEVNLLCMYACMCCSHGQLSRSSGELSMYVSMGVEVNAYGLATISRLLKIIGLFCKKTLSKRLYSAKETYNFKEPTNRSHPIVAKNNTWKSRGG